MTTSLYQDSAAPIDARVDDLLRQMTLDEKLAQLGCLWSTALMREGRFDPDRAAALMPHGIGQITRIGAATGLRPQDSARLMNAIQQVAVERTRLGIPIFVHEESVGGFCHRDATVFPQAIGLGATWDPALIEEVAGVIHEQMLAYAMSEGGRNWNPVQMGPRELREVYAEPFAAAIRDAGLAAIMNSYASIDGLPCAGSTAILTDLLRGELGFQGAVVADYWSVPQLLRFHRVAADRGAAARLALSAGLDMELPTTEFYGAPLKEEVESGRLAA